jgi:hypothetical protein
MHDTALASLHGEFATVVATVEVLGALGTASPGPEALAGLARLPLVA